MVGMRFISKWNAVSRMDRMRIMKDSRKRVLWIGKKMSLS